MIDAVTDYPALAAVRGRRSWSKVTDAAPTRAELLTLVSAAGRVADHSSLRPWRVIELRGDDRLALGAAIATAEGDDKPSTKPLRAPLVLAIVASYRKSDKVPRWEQEAVASGVAHVLSLLLDEAGWGVIWRTGGYTRSAVVARAHGLGPEEELLGWLYVGGKPGKEPGRRKPVDAESLLSRMPAERTDADDASPDPGRADPHGTKPKKKAGKKRKKAAEKAQKAAKKAKKAERRLRKAAKRS